MSESWLLLQSGPGAAAFNMALDEALLDLAGVTGKPVLRFYAWTEPAASFGYSQKHAEVAALTRLRPLVRRPTGGGIVPHDADWTYSVIIPASHPWHRLRAGESYARIHRWLQRAFAKISVPVELAPEKTSAGVGQCFVGAEKSDLLWHNRKIAGAAQRRSRAGLLIQGSVQPPPMGLAKADWQKALCDAGAELMGAVWAAWEPPGAVTRQAEQLAAEKYGRAAFTERR